MILILIAIGSDDIDIDDIDLILGDFTLIFN